MTLISAHPRPPAASARTLTSFEVCSGAGGLALGLEKAGFEHAALVELDHDACRTLHTNRPGWPVVRADLRSFQPPARAKGPAIDLLSGGVPCPPYSIAGRQLGEADERDLFPAMLGLVAALAPRALLIENVKGLMQSKFSAFRQQFADRLSDMGYFSGWKLLYACNFNVPQLRPRAALVAMRPESFERFVWPEPLTSRLTAPTVGQVLYDSMTSRGWELAESWAKMADQIAPTLCGGSRKHGGPDLGPSRAREAWARLGINGSGVADAPPSPGTPLPAKLTVSQMALLQGFPGDWKFIGSKTSSYRQVGNAFPPPMAEALARSIAAALHS